MRFIEIKTTLDIQEDAAKIANMLLDKKLVACVQIFKIESHYVWQNDRERAPEYVLEMKTRRSLFSKVKDEILKVHPYRVPEIIAKPICAGWKEYLKYIKQCTKVEKI